MGEPVAELEIVLTAYTAAYNSAMRGAEVAGTSAAAAAERAGKATLGLGEASSVAATGVQRLAAQQFSSGASVKAVNCRAAAVDGGGGDEQPGERRAGRVHAGHRRRRPPRGPGDG